MKISVNNGLTAVPQSFITKGKQRLKQYVDTVYLKNGDEFEIELFNPKNHKVLAKIELNGVSIGNGIVLRPGERVFLERYLDDAKKFKFETYMVEGNDKAVENAIKNNGDVIIRFYDEYIQPSWNGMGATISTWTTYPSTLTFGTGNPTYTTNVLSGTITSPNLGGTTTSNTYYYNNAAINSTINSFVSDDSVKVETGRVEKGSVSTQYFDYDNTTFNTYTSQTNWWRIKPQSLKPIVREDLVVYCTECGSKRKKDTHKFCPHCGTKF
jgi:Zn finger protein HypA/HybF involved in hydrogenase expression